jgi:hypothetical protein
MVAEQVETELLVFVDEMGTNTSLSPLYAWAKKGQRARDRGPAGPCLATEELTPLCSRA